MPAVITKTIKPAGGGDFTSIAAFIAAIPADMVAVDEKWVGECSGGGETITSTTDLTGITTSRVTDNIVVIRAASGSEAMPDGTGYFITCNSNYRYCLRVRAVDCDVEGLGAKSNASSNVTGFGGNITASFKPRFYDCVAIDCRNGNTSIYAKGFESKRHSFYNCIAINCTFGFSTSNDWYGINTHNCIAKDCPTGFLVKNGASSGSQSSELINCVAYNCTTPWTIGSGLSSASTNNAASDAATNTPPGSSPLTTNVTSSDFVDVANNDFHLTAASILKDSGSNTGYSPDFDGVARDATYDIGPFEFVGGGSVGVSGDLSGIESNTDSFLSSGNLSSGISGNLSATETSSDLFSVIGTLLISGDLSALELNDSFNASGAADTTGNLATSELSTDLLNSTGFIANAGSLSASETGTDSFLADANVIISGDVVVNEPATDTALITGSNSVLGSLSITENSTDLLSSVGQLLINGSFGATELNSDSFLVTGNILIEGDFLTTEQSTDSLLSNGSAATLGTLNVSESNNDSLSATGTVITNGNVDVIENSSDVFVSSGENKIQGVFLSTEAWLDLFQINGVIATGGQVNITETETDLFAAGIIQLQAVDFKNAIFVNSVNTTFYNR